MYGHQAKKCSKIVFVIRDIPVRNRPVPKWFATLKYIVVELILLGH